MADLSHVTLATRKLIEYLIIGIVAIILLVVLFNIGVIVKNIIAPTPPVAPTVAFGKIPLQTFPIEPTTAYTYSINTLTGELPALPSQVNVYQLKQPAPNLLNLDKAKDIAKNAGFATDPTAISDIQYVWSKTDPFPTQLTMDIQSFDFSFSSNYAIDQNVLGAVNLPDETTAGNTAGDFFQSVMPLPGSVDNSKTKETLFAIQNGILTPATSLSSSQIIRIDYFPQNIDNFPILTANPDESLIYALVASSDTDTPQIVEAQYYHKDITAVKATYPVIDIKTAFDRLKKGGAFIASNPSGNTHISITDVSLGYYVDTTPQKYLYPIIIFKGDEGFTAYMSAITDQWVKK